MGHVIHRGFDVSLRREGVAGTKRRGEEKGKTESEKKGELHSRPMARLGRFLCRPGNRGLRLSARHGPAQQPVTGPRATAPSPAEPVPRPVSRGKRKRRRTPAYVGVPCSHERSEARARGEREEGGCARHGEAHHGALGWSGTAEEERRRRNPAAELRRWRDEFERRRRFSASPVDSSGVEVEWITAETVVELDLLPGRSRDGNELDGGGGHGAAVRARGRKRKKGERVGEWAAWPRGRVLLFQRREAGQGARARHACGASASLQWLGRYRK